MPELAILGGNPVRRGEFPAWPPVAEEQKQTEEFSSEDIATLFAVYLQAQSARFYMDSRQAVESLLEALEISPGDEVILPAYGATSLYCNLAEYGLKLVLADISPENYQIDPASVENHITSNTRAVFAGHTGGVTSDLDALGQVCRRAGAYLIEDISQAVGAEWSGLRAGSCGAAALGFFGPESLLSVQGVAVVLANNDDITERIQDKSNSSNRPDSARLGEILNQLEDFPEKYSRREKAAQRLTERLKDIPGISVQGRVKKITARAWSSFILRYNTESFDRLPKARFVEALIAEGIPADTGPPLNTSLTESEALELFPEATKAAYTEAVWLPSRILLADQTALDQVAEAILKIRKFHMELDR